MPKLTCLFGVSLLLQAQAFAQQRAPTGTNPAPFPLGTVVPKVVTISKPDQSYALYLPSAYSLARRWPIVYFFDPGARGVEPVELTKGAAERYGYILVASNNSQNGSWLVESEAAEAMYHDTHDRFSIDPRRLYFAGFSGGARVAANIAQLCKCAAGLLLNGAGFRPEPPLSGNPVFAVFASAGVYDFNYPEIVRMDDELEKLRYSHAFRRFSGPHQWAPESVMDEALAWFRLQAMKTGLEDRDASFIDAQLALESERARAFEQAGDPYSSWKEYRQAAETFAGLADAAGLDARAAALQNDKGVREGVKREKQEFTEQALLTREISSSIAGLEENQENRAQVFANLTQQFTELRLRAEREKNEDKLRVLKRALTAVMVQAVETGSFLDKKDPHRARDYLELALAAGPDSAWVLSNVAVARALDGDHKGALAALRQAKAHTVYPERFLTWIKDEPAFEKLHGSPDFAALLEPPPQH